MKSKTTFILALVAMVVLAMSGAVWAANTVSYGTVGTGATADLVVGGVELSTGSGSAGSAYFRLNIDGGIPLSAITSLSYTSKITTPGAGGYAPEVVLNIDADVDGGLEGTGIDWMQSSHDPLTLGYVDSTDRGDNFLSGDQNPPLAGSADADCVNRDALSGYSYWSADDTRDGLSLTVYHPFGTLVPGMLPVHDIDAADLVYSIDFVVGTSGNFDGMTAIICSVELNGDTYDAPALPPLLTHFTVYEVDPEPVIDGGGMGGNELNIVVDLADQFGHSVLTVKKAKILLVPVSKNGVEIVDGVSHLVCYEIETGIDPAIYVEMVNQFTEAEEVGAQVMEVKKLKYLCVPSTKQDVDAPVEPEPEPEPPKKWCGAAPMYRDGVVNSSLSAADSFGKAFLPLLVALLSLSLWVVIKRRKKD